MWTITNIYHAGQALHATKQIQLPNQFKRLNYEMSTLHKSPLEPI